MALLLLENEIAAPAGPCFQLSLSVDAHTASMGQSVERAVAGVTHGILTGGQVVTWQAKHFGFAFRMTVRVSEYEPPHRFVDEQIRGPFASWKHEHVFTQSPQGGTLMQDRVAFRSPLGPVGAVVDAAVLARYLRRLLERRNTWLKTTLENS